MAAAELRLEIVEYAPRLEARSLTGVDLLVIHCTELPDLATARSYAERIHYPGSRTGNCGHCYVERDGTLHQYVPLDRSAHHVSGHNRRSIGVELVNRGRYPDWFAVLGQDRSEPYPEAQIDGLLRLGRWLLAEVPALRWIAGHEDLDRRLVPATDQGHRLVPRKRDPGPGFPWPRVLSGLPLQRVDADTLPPAAGGELRTSAARSDRG